MSKQVQIRKDTATNLAAATPATGELGYDITNKRLVVGDGSTAGGILIPSFNDDHLRAFSTATASGTNTYTASLTPASLALTAGLEINVTFTNANTASSTLNLDTHGAATIQKMGASGLENLVSGDIVAGGVYKLIYTGSVWRLFGAGGGGGLASVSQGDINTSTGSVSYTASGNQILPGGEYGFHPQTRSQYDYVAYDAYMGGRNTNGLAWTSYSSRLYLQEVSNFSSVTRAYAQQRYVTSSPPFDMGDGQVQGFFFGLVNKNGDLCETWCADVPPWAYNGPTKITADKVDKNGDKYRRILKTTPEEILENPRVELQYEYELITHKIKNADMGLYPHPFGEELLTDKTVVLFNPMCPCIGKLLEAQNQGHAEEVQEILNWFKPDNDKLKRRGPRGVMQCGYQLKKPKKD